MRVHRVDKMTIEQLEEMSKSLGVQKFGENYHQTSLRLFNECDEVLGQVYEHMHQRCEECSKRKVR